MEHILKNFYQQTNFSSHSGINDLDDLFSSLMETFVQATDNRSKFQTLVNETNKKYFKSKHRLEKEWKSFETNVERFQFFANMLGYNVDKNDKPYASMAHFPPYPVEKSNMPMEVQQMFEAKSKSYRNQGNDKFKSGQLSSALNDYNGCIAYAPNAECLALGYANRSAVLLKMDLPLKSLSDISRAFQHGYPEKLRFKLNLRQGECLKKLGKDGQAKNYFNKAKDELQHSGLDSGEISEWAIKIEGHKSSCSVKQNEVPFILDGMPEIEQKQLKIPPLSYGQNNELPHASNGVALKFNEKRGRHLVASRELKLGDVLVVEKAVVTALLESGEDRKDFCSSCFQRSQNLIPCNCCSNAMFCNEKCKQAASKEHYMECLMCAVLISFVDQEDIRGLSPMLMVRFFSLFGIKEVVNMSQKAEKKNSKTPDCREKGFTNGKFLSNLEAILSLESNIKQKSMDDSIKFGILSVVLVELMKNFAKPSLQFGATIFNLLHIFSINSGEIYETYRGVVIAFDRYAIIARGIFPTFALVNHSCDPNIAVGSHGNTLVARVIKPTKKGEEVCVSYNLVLRFQYANKISRMMGLAAYNFTCDCKACIQDWPLRDNMPILPEISNKSLGPAIAASAARVEPHKIMFVNTDTITKEMVKCFSDHVNLLYNAGGRVCKSYNECARGLEQCWHRQGNYFVDKWM